MSYFAVLDDRRGELLLVAHRTAGLWLPPGGHVEPGEDPWAAVVRECREELTPDQVLAEALDSMDHPHKHRFTRKLVRARAS